MENDDNKLEPENSDFISDTEKQIFSEAVSASKIGKKRFYTIDKNFIKTFQLTSPPRINCQKLYGFRDAVGRKLAASRSLEYLKANNVVLQLNVVYPLISKTVMAQIIKCSPRYKAATGVDLMLEISGAVLDLIDQQHLDILIEHELEHIWTEYKDDGTPVLKLLKHNVEDFADIIDKYGMDWINYSGNVLADANEEAAPKK